ncbi:carbohydrate esterase family 4 protein [Amanita muscaria]
MFILSALVLSIAVFVVSRPTEQARRAIPLANLVTQCNQPNMVTLTFDDGPYIWAKNVSDTLTAAGAKGTFFYNGKNWDCVYNLNEIDNVKEYLTVHNEMWLIEQALLRITGTYPAFSQPPYRGYNDLVLQAAYYARGQEVILWDFDSQDSLGVSVQQQKQNYDNIIAQRPENILAINHEVHETTVTEILPYAIEKLQAAGYKLVTVAECLGKQPYQYVSPPAQYDVSTWKC